MRARICHNFTYEIFRFGLASEIVKKEKRQIKFFFRFYLPQEKLDMQDVFFHNLYVLHLLILNVDSILYMVVEIAQSKSKI